MYFTIFLSFHLVILNAVKNLIGILDQLIERVFEVFSGFTDDKPDVRSTPCPRQRGTISDCNAISPAGGGRGWNKLVILRQDSSTKSRVLLQVERMGFLMGFTLLILTACGPKVIEETKSEAPERSSGIFSNSNSNSSSNSNSGSGVVPGASFSEQVHKVFVHEILPTEKYVYLHVHEGEEHFWIATRKQDVRLGGTYYYRNGLLKTNFESKEYNRVFDKIYLVSNLVADNHGGGGSLAQTRDVVSASPSPSTASSTSSGSWNNGKRISPSAGTIAIADLVKNPQAFAGQKVKLKGKCVKINPNIMNRHWIHLQDGSRDDFDLVITSEQFVPEGEEIVIEAVVSLNKDFGAGYQYDLILENGIINGMD